MTDKPFYMHNPFWRVAVNPKSPQITGLWADPLGRGEFGENFMDVSDLPRRPYYHNRLEDPLGGVSGIQALKSVQWSRDCRTTWSRSHKGKASSLRTGAFSYAKGIRERWTIRLTADVLEIQLTRTIAPQVKLNNTLGFLLHTPRDFAFRHVPQFSDAEVEWHEVDTSRQRCLLHASGAYCDLEAWTKNGPLHLMSRYLYHQAIGVALPARKPGTYRCSLSLRPVAQGTLVPIHFQTPHSETGRLATEFYDTYRMANISHLGAPGNGPYHACLATTDLVSNALPDGIACRRAVSVGVDELRQSTQRLLQLCADGAFGETGVISAVHMLGRWHKGCGDGGEVFILDTGVHMALAIYHHFVHTGDRAWLETMLPTARQAVDLVLACDRDHDGLAEAHNTGLPNSHASNFWDEIKYGHKDAYANAWLYGALNAMVELCELVSDRKNGGRYQRQANRLYRAFNGQLWNPRTNRYVGWIDIKGGTHDAFYTSPNLLAIIFGLAPLHRAISILQGIDNSPHAYRLFAISNNLEAPPPTDLGYAQPFGHYENGGVFLINAAWDVLARARYQGGEVAFQKFAAIMEQYAQDRLYGRPHYDGSLAMSYRNGKQSYQWQRNRCEGSGLEPWLADGVTILWSVYRGILGIVADTRGFTLIPKIPEPMADTSVSLYLHGREIEIQYVGCGTKVVEVILNGRRVKSQHWSWEELPKRVEIRIVLQWERPFEHEPPFELPGSC